VETLSGGDEGQGMRSGENRRMLVAAEAMRGWATSGACRMRVPEEAEPRSVVEVAGQGLVELEVGDGLGIGGVEARRLVEHKVTLGWAASRCEGWGFVGKVEVNEDGGDHGRIVSFYELT